MNVERGTVENSHEVQKTLGYFGLSAEIFDRIVRAGYVGWSNCTPHDPKQRAGFDAWADCIRALCDETVPLGWRRIDLNGLPMVVNDQLEACITVHTGDLGTGLRHLTPKQKATKGAVTRAAALQNNDQLDLLEGMFPRIEPSTIIPPHPMWTLLVYISDNEIRSELSLLQKMADGKAKAWISRIILDSINPVGDQWQEGADDEISEIDVPVERKTG